MSAPFRYEVRHAEAEKMLNKIGSELRAACPEGFGFALLIFRFGENGELFYTSNAQREDMIRTMQEFIAKFREN
jgi:hypothetical protein